MTGFLIKRFVKNYKDTDDKTVRESYGKLGGAVGIASNIFLCIIKITAALISGSISIMADGLNNLSDMGSSVITLIGFKMAGKPADSDHPFGHGRIEYMSAFIVSMLILLVGGELIISSVKALILGGEAAKYSLVSIIILIISIIVKFWLYLFNRKLGKSIDSTALFAAAQDSVNDSISTIVILISAIISMFVKLPFNLDAVLAIGVGLFIIYSGISSAKETVNSILGSPADKETIESLEKEILVFEEFLGIHDLIVHNYGPGRQFASVHVEVPQNTDIVRCHEKIDLCERIVKENLDIELVIHMDPIDTDDETVSQVRLSLAERITDIDERLTIHDFRMTPFGESRTNLIFDVVVPSSVNIPQGEIVERIKLIAKQINSSYECVITVDNDFTGK